MWSYLGFMEGTGLSILSRSQVHLLVDDGHAWTDWIRAVEEIRSGRGNLELDLKPEEEG
jgi:hypothetical protein